ncbi:MAG: hypothetical protein WKF77_01765 [Planctomycetaceae bacterium]
MKTVNIFTVASELNAPVMCGRHDFEESHAAGGERIEPAGGNMINSSKAIFVSARIVEPYVVSWLDWFLRSPQLAYDFRRAGSPIPSTGNDSSWLSCKECSEVEWKSFCI